MVCASGASIDDVFTCSTMLLKAVVASFEPNTARKMRASLRFVPNIVGTRAHFFERILGRTSSADVPSPLTGAKLSDSDSM